MSNYPFSIPIEVIFRDIDSFTHVNNAIYFTYFETARIKFMAHLLGVEGSNEIPLILAEAQCSYRSPAYMGELLTVRMRVSYIGHKSFHLAYEVVSRTDGRLVAEGRTVQVMYDYHTDHSITIPDEVHQLLAEYMGDDEE